MEAKWIRQHRRLCLSSLRRNLWLKVNKKVSYLNKKSLRVFEFRDSYVLYMFYRNEHYMAISHIALIVNMLQWEWRLTTFLEGRNIDNLIEISSSSSCCTASTDLPDPLSPPISIVHRFRELFRATSCIGIELLYIASSCCPVFARPREGVHRCISLMSASLLLQKCHASLVRLTLIVFVMGRSWSYKLMEFLIMVEFFQYISSNWRCPWCNGYRRRKWTRWHEFKSWTRLITFHIALIPLRKVWIQLFSLPLWVNSRAN